MSSEKQGGALQNRGGRLDQTGRRVIARPPGSRSGVHYKIPLPTAEGLVSGTLSPSNGESGSVTKTRPYDYESELARRADARTRLIARYHEARKRQEDLDLFYPLRYEAQEEAEKLKQALKALKGTPVSPRWPIPTSRKLQLELLDRDARSRQEPTDDLRALYDAAVTAASDPHTTPLQKHQAKIAFILRRAHLREGIDALPENTLAQKERKRGLKQQLDLWVTVNPDVDWAHDRLLPFRQAVQRCEETRDALWLGRTEERVRDFLASVAALRQTYEDLKRLRAQARERASVTNETPEAKEERFFLERALPEEKKGRPQETTLSHPIKNFRGFPSDPKPAQVRPDKRKIIYNTLKAQARVEEAASEEAKQVREQERQHLLLKELVASFERQALDEAEAVRQKRMAESQKTAIANYSLDDIARIKKAESFLDTPLLAIREASPTLPPFYPPAAPLPVLKTNRELLEETRASIESEVEALEKELRARFGARELPKEEVFTQSRWSWAKDTWHRTFTKGYISNASRWKSYVDKKLRLQDIEDQIKRPDRAVVARVKLREETAELATLAKTLRERDTSPDAKNKAIERCQVILHTRSDQERAQFAERTELEAFNLERKHVVRGIRDYQSQLQNDLRSLEEDIHREERFGRSGSTRLQALYHARGQLLQSKNKVGVLLRPFN